MKTVITTLPIYKALRDQYYERGLSNGSVQFAPIFCPKHRLPSFQWMDDGDGCLTVSSIYLVNKENIGIDITLYFVTLPTLYTSVDGDVYFIYGGETLNNALPEGNYYLKITMDNNYIYYSDWFTVQCVYCNFVNTFIDINFTTPLVISGTTITTAISTGAAQADSTPLQSVYLGQSISIIFNLLTNVGATSPSFSVVSTSLGVISNVVIATTGLNELTLTTIRAADDCFIRISTTAGTNFSTSEILIYAQYACGYVTLSFSNCCNLGDLLYEDDFVQTLWIKSDNIEQAYPYVEKGQENGQGKFIPTFRRQEKTYLIKTGIISQYLVEVLQKLKMHDIITYVDQVGDAWNVETVDTEQEWLFDDKYYANASITIDLGESIISSGCCE